MRIPTNFADKRRPETVDGEGARDLQRLTRRNVGVDLVIGYVGERDERRRHAARGPTEHAAAVVNEPVPGVQLSLTAALQHPSLSCDFGKVRLSVDDTVEFEERVAAENKAVDLGADNRRGLEPREKQHGLCRCERRVGCNGSFLIDVGGQEYRLYSHCPEGREASG